MFDHKMKDELREIEQEPDFPCSLDPRTLAEIKTEEAREMAIYLDKERQRGQWVKQLAWEGYNMSVRNTNFRRKYGWPIILLVWFVSLVIAGVGASIGSSVFKPPVQHGTAK